MDTKLQSFVYYLVGNFKLFQESLKMFTSFSLRPKWPRCHVHYKGAIGESRNRNRGGGGDGDGLIKRLNFITDQNNSNIQHHFKIILRTSMRDTRAMHQRNLKKKSSII